MPTSITLKNIPDEIYERLKKEAELHHRSLNGHVLACLEKVLMPARLSAEEHLEKARQIRSMLKGRTFKSADISKFKKQGRP